jgi:acyl-CoA reductase-like NAD-dependent aldehyde dehydrogenase
MATETKSEIRTFANINPATGAVISEHPCASPVEVRSAVELARASQPAWAARPVNERLNIISKFKELLLAGKDEVARTITTEAGKPLVEALLSEVVVALDAAKFVIENVHRFLRDESIPHANLAMKTKRGILVREPLGVIGIIAPWNYPFSTPATETLQALALGNAVVLKPSEFTPLSALKLRDLLHEAGVPREIFQVVLGEGPTGAALIDSGIDKLIFTGSVATGKKVAQECAARLVPVVLELGGKDAMIVLEDADVDVASSGAVWGAMMNAGQTCLSVERCYVHRSRYQEFVAKAATKLQSLKVGYGSHLETEVGPMISERQIRIVETQVDEARAEGAKVVCGGRRLSELGTNFYAPTLVTDVAPEMKIMREETFGPVLPVIPFDSDEDAVRMANESEFGLAASVWTNDLKRGETIARRLEAGTVMVNDVLSCFAIAEAPHGGVKSSGIGRTHGWLGMAEMVRVKYVDIDRMPRMKKLWWYGYGERFGRQMGAFAEMLFGSGAERMKGALGSRGALWRKRR